MIGSIANNRAIALAGRLVSNQPTGVAFEDSLTRLREAGQRIATRGVQIAAPSSSMVPSIQPSFSSMTRQELHEWTNEQVRSGKLGEEDGMDFEMMSGSIPIDGSALDDGSFATRKLDFVQIAQQGLSGALARGDAKEAAILKKALGIMGADRTQSSDNVSTADSSVKLKEALAAFKKEAALTPVQRTRRDVLKAMNLTEDAIKAMPPKQQKATEQKIAAEVARRLRLGEGGKDQMASATASAVATDPESLSV